MSRRGRFVFQCPGIGKADRTRVFDGLIDEGRFWLLQNDMCAALAWECSFDRSSRLAWFEG